MVDHPPVARPNRVVDAPREDRTGAVDDPHVHLNPFELRRDCAQAFPRHRPQRGARRQADARLERRRPRVNPRRSQAVLVDGAGLHQPGGARFALGGEWSDLGERRVPHAFVGVAADGPHEDGNSRVVGGEGAFVERDAPVACDRAAESARARAIPASPASRGVRPTMRRHAVQRRGARAPGDAPRECLRRRRWPATRRRRGARIRSPTFGSKPAHRGMHVLRSASPGCIAPTSEAKRAPVFRRVEILTTTTNEGATYGYSGPARSRHSPLLQTHERRLRSNHQAVEGPNPHGGPRRGAGIQPGPHPQQSAAIENSPGTIRRKHDGDLALPEGGTVVNTSRVGAPGGAGHTQCSNAPCAVTSNPMTSGRKRTVTGPEASFRSVTGIARSSREAASMATGETSDRRGAGSSPPDTVVGRAGGATGSSGRPTGGEATACSRVSPASTSIGQTSQEPRRASGHPSRATTVEPDASKALSRAPKQ